MKRILLPLAIFFFFLAIFFWWKYNAVQAKFDTLVTTGDTTRCGSCKEYNNMHSSSKLDYNLLRAMTYNYQHNAATSAINATKTRSVWLSINKLKQFVYDVENNTCKCPESKLGVRIYFGDYPSINALWTSTDAFKNDLNNASRPDGDFYAFASQSGTNQYLGRTSILLVPTIADASGKNIDFDPLSSNANKSCLPGYDTTTFKQIASGSISSKEFGQNFFNNPSYFTNYSSGSLVMALSATNHGDACPPSTTNCQDKGALFDY